ncbi:MAG: maleylpyruvate isomerase N-terminal domain-containing protein, partial [Mycobacteriaceae bacterium]
MDSPACRTLTSAAAWFLEVAAHAEGNLDEGGLGGWNVRDLLGHTSRALSTIESYLEADTARGIEVDLVDAAAYYRATQAARADPEAVAQRGRAARAALGDDPLAGLQALA